MLSTIQIINRLKIGERERQSWNVQKECFSFLYKGHFFLSANIKSIGWNISSLFLFFLEIFSKWHEMPASILLPRPSHFLFPFPLGITPLWTRFQYLSSLPWYKLAESFYFGKFVWMPLLSPLGYRNWTHTPWLYEMEREYTFQTVLQKMKTFSWFTIRSEQSWFQFRQKQTAASGGGGGWWGMF